MLRTSKTAPWISRIHSREFIRSLYRLKSRESWVRTAPPRERSDTQKVPRGLHDRYQNSHRTATRAIRHAESAERVARPISKFAPHHNESDPTRAKCREGCAGNIKTCTASQREWSETHKVTRGLREHILDFYNLVRAPRKMNIDVTCFTYYSI